MYLYIYWYLNVNIINTTVSAIIIQIIKKKVLILQDIISQYLVLKLKRSCIQQIILFHVVVKKFILIVKLFVHNSIYSNLYYHWTYNKSSWTQDTKQLTKLNKKYSINIIIK